MLQFESRFCSVYEWFLPCVLVLIQRENGSMEKELEELRRSRPKPQDGGDFTLSDCFYFTRRGIESIVEDEVQMDFPVNTVRQLQFCSFPPSYALVSFFLR